MHYKNYQLMLACCHCSQLRVPTPAATSKATAIPVLLLTHQPVMINTIIPTSHNTLSSEKTIACQCWTSLALNVDRLTECVMIRLKDR